MKKSLKNMPADARLWVYQSDRKLDAEQVKIIEDLGSSFIETWAAHGAGLNASFDILYNRFIIIAVDEKQALASGCSIDKSVQFVKDVEKKVNLNLFDRLNIAYRIGDEILSCSLAEFELLASKNKVDETTIVFNNMVTTKSEFDSNWEVPLVKSWQSRVLV